MDVASFVGIIAGIGLIFGAIKIGGSLSGFINTPGLMIVVGGTMATTLLTFQLEDVLRAVRAAYFIFTQKKDDPNRMVETMVKLCRFSRQLGIVKLSDVKTQSRFLKKSCDLIADGSSEADIRSSLRTEIESLKMRHFIVQDVFRKMGTYAPAFGMLGTLIGLIQMLSRMQDPSTVGPSMAIALLTTFYGSLLSTLIFLPIAGKLKARTIIEVINLEIIFEGAICILDVNNPLLVYEKLSSYIPAKYRKPLEAMRTEFRHKKDSIDK